MSSSTVAGGPAAMPRFPVWSTLYRRTDGDAWREVTEGVPARDGTAMGKLATNVAEPGVFYYVTVPGELYRSDDAGSSWALVECSWPDELPSRKVLAAAAGQGERER